ncbi:cell division protein FtsQ/DivIB [Brevibacterium litoralis]|uniref:cell division protein FtsQ/DivIB n=1 Tax=Brevibacterium litoralis TaxID=3138935 RepID=UPI0032EE3E6B
MVRRIDGGGRPGDPDGPTGTDTTGAGGAGTAPDGAGAGERDDTVSLGLTRRLEDFRRRRRRIRLVLAGVLAGVLALAGVAWFSPLLAVDTVTVSGSERVDTQELETDLWVAHGGTPLPRVRPGAVESAVLAAHPQLAAAEVRWSGPRAIHVELTDRTPVLAVRTGEDWTTYDAAGVPLDAPAAAPEGMPVLVLESAQASGADTGDSAGSDTPGPEPIVADALTVLGALPAEAGLTVHRMQATSPADIALVVTREGEGASDAEDGAEEAAGTAEEVTLRVGTTADLDRKMEVATVLLETGAHMIDVSVPGVPVTEGADPVDPEEPVDATE